ncbi:uncharacterized protein C8Q71DRAFT_732643 [Rhodofomes roseus]|uniref:Uncharacterized protein n=1 Tax=Rhodofomes roseus TaxID=34475 RepID=A0ABQ8KTI1_9APHY|nr:uncharacterized protein C8Q71DRAFT_732643 [Rhodofomes roseus]KAH9842388.1 hypothetical protein C8Q71DRAFT_732643 [Rhodofomes roseus]
MGCYNCLEPDDSEEGGLEHLVGMLIDHVQFLYSANARCFLIIDVPAVDRAPAHWEDADRVRGQISDWNELLRESVCAFAEEEEYSDVSLFVFSSHKMLSDLLDDVEEFGFDEEDERRVNGKIWVDREDVTVSKEVHRLLADKMQLAITLAEE